MTRNSKPTRAIKPVEGPGLGLGGGAGSPVGLTAGLGRRALVVVAPLGRVVAVGVHAVDGGDPAVAVVVAQVLAPQPVAGGEREVVAVGVGDRHEPQLGRVDQLGECGVGAVAVDHVMGEAAYRLRPDPLPGVLAADVERRRPAAVTDAAGVPGHLEGDDVLALHRLADRDELGDVRMFGGELLELVLQAARRTVGPEHLVAVRGRDRPVLRRRPEASHQQAHADDRRHPLHRHLPPVALPRAGGRRAPTSGPCSKPVWRADQSSLIAAASRQVASVHAWRPPPRACVGDFECGQLLRGARRSPSSISDANRAATAWKES